MAADNLYDLKRLFKFREVLEGLDAEASPHALISDKPLGITKGAVGVLSGSFNPPTFAHMELARRVKESFRLNRVYFTISRVTIDKERVEGLVLEDRLHLLSELTDPLEWASVAVVNKGLYFEQAQAFRSQVGGKAKMQFIVGMDKVLQIFAPRYY